METKEQKTSITVQTTINAPVKKVWHVWTEPEHIIRWNSASGDWHTPRAENDLREGGRFFSRMEARDGSQGFDFTGVYNKVDDLRQINYTMDDGRKVQITFEPQGNTTTVRESFDAETTNSVEMQRQGWQSILENFKNYVENLSKKETLHFEISINAPVEKVYKTMLHKTHYSDWTTVFNPTSRYEGSWDTGSKILFIGTDEKGNEGGMVSVIKENIPNKKVSIEHQGMLEGGKEITGGPEVSEWAGAIEEYIFKKDGNHTKLLVDVDVTLEFKTFMDETWPMALNRLKTICEKV